MDKHLKVKADIKKNRLYFTIAGSIKKGDLDKLYTDVRFCVADLKQGFDVITDLTECDLAHLNGLPTFRKIMHYLATNGVRDVVRIINPDTLIHHQVINYAALAACYKSLWVSSRQEAEEFLDKSIRRSSLRFSLPDTKIIMCVGDHERACSLLDISATGCSFITTSSQPVDAEILLKLSLPSSGVSNHSFEIASKIIWATGNRVAVSFTFPDTDDSKRLKECLKGILQR